jgi:enoyl-CoA hydratase
MADIEVTTADGIATVVLNRPPVNAFTTEMYEQLGDVFAGLGESLDVNCAILTASGTKAFCAGKDLKEFLATTIEEDPGKAAIVRRTFSSILHCRIPVIAAVNGPALGAGCVITTVCDIRLASEDATFSLPEINVGRCGGGAHLGRLVSQGQLRKMFFTGQAISAAEAYRAGLVDGLSKPGDLMSDARTLAATIAAKAPLGLRIGKQSLNEIEGLTVDEGYPIEQQYSTKLMATQDAREATRAVLEKRAPVFKGR